MAPLREMLAAIPRIAAISKSESAAAILPRHAAIRRCKGMSGLQERKVD